MEDASSATHPVCLQGTCAPPPFRAAGRLHLGVFTLVTRSWAASEFLTGTSKFNMMPNGERQIIGPGRSHIFDAGVNFLTRASPT